nr:transposon Ty3-G Gag-Pol polyprotein [Tanacetum cinerariifolium]
MIGDAEETENENPTNDALETQADEVQGEISFHAISRTILPQTLRLPGRIQHKDVVVLVDGGSTHNFVDQELVNRLGLQVDPTVNFSVVVANRDKLACTGRVRNLSLVVQGCVISIDFFVLLVAACPIVLGVQWLKTLGPIEFDFNNLTMGFHIAGSHHKLQGLKASELSALKSHELKGIFSELKEVPEPLEIPSDPQPEKILEERVITKGKYRPKTEVLIKSVGQPLGEATWENKWRFFKTYPAFRVEDNAGLSGVDCYVALDPTHAHRVSHTEGDIELVKEKYLLQRYVWVLVMKRGDDGRGRMRKWSSYARAMLELRVDVELKDNIVAVMPKITREGYYTCNIRVEYEWKPPWCACCKVIGHVLDECLKNIGAGATKNLKKTSQTPKGILVGQKMGFKPKQVYERVSKKSIANTCGKKINNSESTKEVSKLNPFEVLTSIDNDVDLGTNKGILNSVDKGTFNVSSSNTPTGGKINKIERQICEGKLRFVDDDGNLLVPTSIGDSDSEVEVVFDETANLRISTSGKEESDKGYGTNSLLRQ